MLLGISIIYGYFGCTNYLELNHFLGSLPFRYSTFRYSVFNTLDIDFFLIFLSFIFILISFVFN